MFDAFVRTLAPYGNQIAILEVESNEITLPLSLLPSTLLVGATLRLSCQTVKMPTLAEAAQLADEEEARREAEEGSRKQESGNRRK